VIYFLLGTKQPHQVKVIQDISYHHVPTLNSFFVAKGDQHQMTSALLVDTDRTSDVNATVSRLEAEY
jgi:hypothetical protein